MSIIFKTLTNYFDLKFKMIKVSISDSLFIVSTHQFIFLIVDYYSHLNGLDPDDLKVILSDSLFIVSTHRFIFLIIDYYLHSYGLYPEYLKVIHIN